MSTNEQNLINKTAEKLSQMLPYGQQIQQLQQNIGVIASSLQTEILTKITTLLTENIEAVLPDLPKMKQKIDDAVEEVQRTAEGGDKNFSIAMQNKEQIEEIKGEFEYMKTRFSPQFVQRVDKALSSLTTIAYDVEVVKMTASHAAMKKDLDLVEQRL